jgi:methionyl-tRNA synthetase
MSRVIITTAIPYVNGDPHLGFALECVQADVLARHRRLRGAEVRLLSGTDENALKNVEAAAAAGVPVREYVDGKAQRFAALGGPLQLSLDDFIRTSCDPRHRPGVERLWRACAAAGDLYQHEYEGLYCTGCEAFVADEVCPEHGRRPERVAERNWFFRLSRYEEAVHDALASGRLRVEPEHRRNEALAFVRGGLADLSVSRPAARAHGWGIPVPDDPEQIVYVWFDALANYVTASHEWWERSDERVHVIGKGILRFHAVYWPAILLSAREPLPTAIFVHDYLTERGSKLSKSTGHASDPLAVVGRHGVDALRWWLLRDVPRAGDVDFREELLAARANELAGELGNLVNRTIALVVRLRGRDWEPPESRPALLPAAIDEALARFDFRTATDALWAVVREANRLVSTTRPWELDDADRVDAILGELVAVCRTLARELSPFLPAASERIAQALDARDNALGRTLFARSERVLEQGLEQRALGRPRARVLDAQARDATFEVERREDVVEPRAVHEAPTDARLGHSRAQLERPPDRGAGA